MTKFANTYKWGYTITYIGIMLCIVAMTISIICTVINRFDTLLFRIANGYILGTIFIWIIYCVIVLLPEIKTMVDKQIISEVVDEFEEKND